MADPSQQAALDQANAELGETLSSTWWAIFWRCVDKGFTEQQALSLLESFILTEPFADGEPD